MGSQYRLVSRIWYVRVEIHILPAAWTRFDAQTRQTVGKSRSGVALRTCVEHTGLADERDDASRLATAFKAVFRVKVGVVEYDENGQRAARCSCAQSS